MALAAQLEGSRERGVEVAAGEVESRHHEGRADEGLDDARELGLDVGDGPGGDAAQRGGHSLNERPEQDGHLQVRRALFEGAVLVGVAQLQPPDHLDVPEDEHAAGELRPDLERRLAHVGLAVQHVLEVRVRAGRRLAPLVGPPHREHEEHRGVGEDAEVVRHDDELEAAGAQLGRGDGL